MYTMKKYILLLTVWMFSLQAEAQIRQAKLQASGLTCALCAKAVYANLESLPFIQKIDTDLNGSAFILEFNEKPIDIDAIRKKVEDAGFSVAGLDLTASFNNVEIEADKHINYQGMVFHFMGSRKNTLNGEHTVRVVDKNFILSKEQKKMQGLTKMACYSTGMMSDCCKAEKASEPQRVYHLMAGS